MSRFRTAGIEISVVLPILVATMLLGCGQQQESLPNGTGIWRASVDTLGHTVTVRTLEGSVWGSRARLVEEASIGTAAGEEFYLFGDVRGITASRDRIFVLDWQLSMVRVYDHEGRYLQDIGRQGSGPGEFRDPIAIDLDEERDRLYVRDRVGGLVHVFTLAGEYVETLRAALGGNISSLTKTIRLSENGTPYLLSLMFFPNPRTPDMISSRYVMLGMQGGDAPYDTLGVPWYDYRGLQIQGSGLQPWVTVPFSPGKNWNMTRSRAMIGGVSDSYRFEIRHYDGRHTTIEREVAPIPVLPEESRWYITALADRMRLTDPDWMWRGPAMPDLKPAFEAFIPDRNERIWVIRKGPGVMSGDSGAWSDTWLLDVFEEESGRYLGGIEVPPGIRFQPEPCIFDDQFIAYCQDEAGVPYVRRYRLRLPD
ncbi:6-bladed beta-propeller [Gemmatimonadota bacterium]